MPIPKMKFSFHDCNGVRLHIAEAGPGDGPVVFLLHGFPDFWYGWRDQIGALVAAGFRVIAPDQRGYNLSDKPKETAAYDLDRLADDIVALADSLGCAKVRVVGHDWGGNVAWWAMAKFPHRFDRVAILNCPHPAVWRDAMDNDPAQRKLSWYVKAFALPALPEFLLKVRNYAALIAALKDSKAALSSEDEALYRKAWSQPGALTGAINWYRAFLKRRFVMPKPNEFVVPTLLLWGRKDKYGVPALAEASVKLCANGSLTYFPEATHWLPHDEPAKVNEALLAFLRA
jgi:pimeloyl-ACP methyl ester carboxylesterase